MAATSDSVSIRVPYKNLREAEVELVGIDLNSPSSSQANGSGNHSPATPTKNINLMTLILSCTVAAGVQFGWALQLSLLTPYIQVSILIFGSCAESDSSFLWGLSF